MRRALSRMFTDVDDDFFTQIRAIINEYGSD
ncbi:unnamed protein product [Strongylus vulgaris]|uniref:Uncharacterized protein n=1 Tax=Strongylus vulgaris TaxID=40348 RepID=A0A3P7IVC5_STRVU|nr:unnamed protein product [Strongylus vulgaris]